MDASTDFLLFGGKFIYNIIMITFDSSSVQGEISSVLRERFQDPSDTTTFIFATSIALSSWVDWLCENLCQAVPLERFLAWDDFKRNQLHLTQEGAETIPSLLRKIFVQNLLLQGTSFPSLIPPSVASSKSQAVAFSDWLASILPSLKLWHQKQEEAKSSNPDYKDDDADLDYEKLYQLYDRFLKGEGRQGPVFYESAWLDKEKVIQALADLKDDYIIFYPEILDDWEEYRPFIEKCPRIKIISLPEEEKMDPRTKKPTVQFFTNARSELRSTALEIRKLNEEGIPWNQIAVSIPDLENWRPYVEREFSLYCIPHIVRAGQSLTLGAGRIFREMQTCVDENFSFDSVKALLLDQSLPWKDPQRNMFLIRDALESKCLVNIARGDKDLWEESLSAANSGNTSEAELRLYKKLKSSLSGICNSKSFEEIYKNWFTFKNELLDAPSFTKEDDLRISRCIAILDELKSLEKDFFGLLNFSCADPFSFFLREIEKTVYQPQNSADGISVFDYKVAAASAFSYHFVLNLTQSDASLSSASLSFLSSAKRKALGLSSSTQISDSFVRLYGSDSHSRLSVSENTFSGFAIPYSILDAPSKPQTYGVPEEDFISRLRSSLQSDDGISSLSSLQKEGLDNWAALSKRETEDYGVSQQGREKVYKKVHILPRYPGDSYRQLGLPVVSQSDLKEAVVCMRKWLFKRVLSIEEESLDTDLLQVYDVGSINHKILELFSRWCLAEKGGRLPILVNDTLSFSQVTDGGKADGEGEIFKKLVEFTEQAIEDPKMNFSKSILAKNMLLNQKTLFAQGILTFLRTLCSGEGFGNSEILEIEGYHNLKVSLEGGREFVYTGGLDLLVRDTGGKDSVIDFKNSKSAVPNIKDCVAQSCKDLKNFQMLIYARLWNESAPQHQLEKATFYSVKTGEDLPVRNPDKSFRSVPDRNELFDACLASIDQEVALPFAEKVQALELQPDPDRVISYRDCADCAYRSICRTTYTIAGESL